MAVRGKDIQTLQRHICSKALLMGKCLDNAITLKKTTPDKVASDKILSDKYVKGWVDEHLKFIELADHPHRVER